MAKFFDEKVFNPEAFAKYMQAVPNERMNRLRASRAITNDARLREVFKDNTQTGTSYAIIPYFGLLGGAAQNYNGVDNLTPGKTGSYKQGVFTYGRMAGWTEADFSYDITGGADFEANIRAQIQQYWNQVDQDVFLSILKGVFSMTGAPVKPFIDNHVTDISAVGDGMITATTLNSAIQKAAGDNKSAFSLVLMHSAVATNLENINLLNHLKYTDANGVQRDLELATWNGRTVVIDDAVPTELVTEGNKTKYTTYALGNGAIGFEEVGAKVPFEMSRDAYKRGGETTLISRRRNAISVAGISYKQSSQATDSPTNAELEKAANWELVSDAKGQAISHKLVPFAKIVSLG